MADKPQYDSIIQEALDRFRLAQEADESWRVKSLEALKFSVGDQWDVAMRTRRERYNKPCLTMDQIQQSVRLVCNQYRQQPPSIDVNPVGDGADTDSAEILQGMVRHIETISDAQVVYEQTHEGTVRAGFHSFRLLTEYVDDDSDEQEIYIVPIRNAFSVYWQPGVPQEKARWAFIINDIPWDTYKTDHKDSQMASLNEMTATGNTPPNWVTKEYVRVAEYFTVEDVNRGEGKRPGKKVHWRKINAIEIMDERDLPGKSIGIFTCYGDDLDVDGERCVQGLVHNAIGAQQMYNYTASKIVEVTALSSITPWIAVAGSLAGREEEWQRANSGEIQVLQYNQVDISGKPAPRPERDTSEPPIQALTLQHRQEALDLKAAMGIYDPSLGQRKGDESGTAIKSLQQQGSIATLNYSDNMTRVLRRAGRELLEWIRVIYDTPRVQRIIKPDGSVDHIVIHNGPDQAEAANQLLTDKIKQIFDVSVGRYDVVISVGPSYQSKRQEAVATQLDFLKLLPPAIAINYIDLVTANMDWPQAKEFAARAKKMLPPQLQDGDDSDPQVKAQKLEATLQQMTQQHELLTQHVNDLTQQINTKQIEQQGKVAIAQAQAQADMTIQKMKIDAQIAIAEIESKAQDVSERRQWVMDAWKELHGSAHDVALQAHQQAHEKDLAAQQAAQAQQSQASDQQHEQTMAEQAQEPEPVGQGASQ